MTSPKDCQLQQVVLCSAACSLNFLTVLSLAVICQMLHVAFCVCLHFCSHDIAKRIRKMKKKKKNDACSSSRADMVTYAGLGCVCVCLVEGCGSKVGLRRRGVIISPCHRCISLEYLWFYTPVTQLCVFALTLKQRHHSCRSFRTESAMIVTKLIVEECEGKCRREFCAEALR